MNPLRYSFFVFAGISANTLIPTAILVLLPNIWWGLLVKAVAALWAISTAGNLLRDTVAVARVYGGSGPGIIISMVLFGLCLSLNYGAWRMAVAVLFSFLSAVNFQMIYGSAKSWVGVDTY